MPGDDRPETPEQITVRLEQLGRYSRFVKAGLGVIVGAFLLSVLILLPSNLDSLETAVGAILLPLIFVGMGLLLFGIGMHLHLMHLNVVRQIRASEDSKPAGEEDS